MEKFLQKLSSRGSKQHFNVYEVCAAVIRAYQKYWKEILIAGGTNAIVSFLFLSVFFRNVPANFFAALFLTAITASVDFVLLLYINEAVHGRKITLQRAIKKYFDIILPVALISILFDGLLIVGIIALLIPGLLVFLVYGQAVYFVLFEHKKPLESFPASAKLTKGRRWGIFYFFVVLAFAYLLSSILFGWIQILRPEINAIIGAFGGVATYTLWLQLHKQQQ